MTTYYVNNVTGDDIGNDGRSEEQAFATIGKGLDTVAAGDTLYIKKTANPYTAEHKNGAIAEIQTAGTGEQPIIIEGYTTTPGDGTLGCVVLDGQDSLACITSVAGSPLAYVFKYLRCTQSTGSGWNLSGISYWKAIACEADYNSGRGFHGGSYVSLYGCSAHHNTGALGRGMEVGLSANIVNCQSYNNADHGIRINAGHVLFSLLYGNGDDALYFSAVTYVPSMVANCTIEGNDKAHIGLVADGLAGRQQYQLAVMNTIFYKCSRWINASQLPNDSLPFFSTNNLYYDNDPPNGDPYYYPIGDNAITGQDPLFVDPGNGDYRLKITSPALRAGYPSYLDIGAMQAQLVPLNPYRGIQ